MSSDKLARSSGVLGLIALAAVISCSIAALPYTGVNLSGAEWTSGPYWPTTQEIDFFASRGMNTIRLPFEWENLQPTALGDFDSTAWNQYTSLTDYITNTKGLYVIVEVHNFARYKGEIVGDGVSVNVLLDLWTRLANYYKSNDKVLFNIMNEPNNMPTMLWATNANATVQAIRDTGATNIVLVPGNGWTGAWSWNEKWIDIPGNQVSNAEAMVGVVDPLNNMIFEFHQYFDEDSSGGHPNCQARPIGTSTVSVATNWLKQHNKKGFLGELGGSDQVNCINAINDALTHLEANSDVWMGWTYWSGGPRTSTAFLAIGPLGYPPVQNTQLETLLNYVVSPITAMIFPNISATSCNNSPAMVIYDDELQNNWEDWGWAASRTFSDNDAASGTSAISFSSAGNFEGLQLTLPSKFSFVNYNAIQFDVKGASADLNYEIFFIEDETSPGRSQALRGYTPSHSLTTAYQTATVPFSVFHFDSAKQLKAIVWQSAENVQGTLYLDNIKLVCVDVVGGSLSGSVAAPGTSNPPPSSTPSAAPGAATPITKTPSVNVNESASLIGSVTFVVASAAALLL
jgi:endoglucanase